MNRKLIKFISVLFLIIALIMYFTIAYHFDNDRHIMRILAKTDFEATLLRLSIYIVPGISVIAGVFGLVFTTRGLLSFVGVLEVFAGLLTLYYQGRSQIMNIMGIVILVLGLLFLLLVLLTLLTDKKETKVV